MNDAAIKQHEALLEHLRQRNAEHEPNFWILVNERQCRDLSCWYVPDAVKAMASTMLDWEEELERKAARPVPKPSPKRGGRRERAAS